MDEREAGGGGRRDITDVTLLTVAGGAVPEKFERALMRAVENILDPNTEPTDARKITIDVTLKPGEDRVTVNASVRVKTRLADPKKDIGTVYVGERDGEPAAVTYDPGQGDLFGGGPEREEDRVRPLRVEDGREAASGGGGAGSE